jgi:histidinol-phosphate aminotransferase
VQQLNPYAYIPGNAEIAKKYDLKLQDVVRFDRNTPPTVLPSVKKELKQIAREGGQGTINEYPDPKYSELSSLLASYLGVAAPQLLLGNGADEIIDMLVKAFVEPGDTVVIPTPTFSFYEVTVASFGGKSVNFNRNIMDFSIDIGKLVAFANSQNAKMIFLCNPNSPAPAFTSLDDLERIAKEFRGVLVIDEAYIAFSGQKSAASICSKYENVIVIGTLSKSFALAGQRVGYAVCSTAVATELNKIRQPYNLDGITERLAIAALKNGMSEMCENVRRIISERERLSAAFAKLGFKVYPSFTNFILLGTTTNDASIVYEKLIRKGLVVRKMHDGLRITVRSKKDNSRLLNELAKISDGIIFDIDGVLVDVSQSYREAIRQTAEAITGKKFTAADVATVKKLPDSNNDWEVTYALIKGITSGNEMKKIDRNSSSYLAAKQKFQELYLGGLRDKEKLLITTKTLTKLKTQNYKLGIVTSRPREEALYVLRDLIPFFPEDCIIAQEDCEEEKPSPKPLLLAKERMGCRAALYIGDSINDQLAAKAAKMRFASVVKGLKADVEIDDVNKIIEVI